MKKVTFLSVLASLGLLLCPVSKGQVHGASCSQGQREVNGCACEWDDIQTHRGWYWRCPIKSKQKSCPDNTITVGTDTNGRLRCAPFAPPGNGWDEVWKEVERGHNIPTPPSTAAKGGPHYDSMIGLPPWTCSIPSDTVHLTFNADGSMSQMEDPSPPGSEVNQHLIWVRGTKIGFDGRCLADSWCMHWQRNGSTVFWDPSTNYSFGGTVNEDNTEILGRHFYMGRDAGPMTCHRGDAPEDPTAAAKLHYGKAKEATRAKNYSRAAAELREAIRLLPTNATLQYDLGVVLKAQAQNDEAAAALQRAVQLGLPTQLQPESSAILGNMAEEKAQEEARKEEEKKELGAKMQRERWIEGNWTGTWRTNYGSYQLGLGVSFTNNVGECSAQVTEEPNSNSRYHHPQTYIYSYKCSEINGNENFVQLHFQLQGANSPHTPPQSFWFNMTRSSQTIEAKLPGFFGSEGELAQVQLSHILSPGSVGVHEKDTRPSDKISPRNAAVSYPGTSVRYLNMKKGGDRCGLNRCNAGEPST